MALKLDPDRRYVIAGVTGAVGVEMLDILHAAGVPASSVVGLASPRSVGKEIAYGDGAVTVGLTEPAAFEAGDVGLFSCGSGPSKGLAPAVVERGAWVIDNSSAFRMTDGVPLVVPEINASAMDHLTAKAGVIANPNCSTIIMLLPLNPLRERFGVRAIRAATYQAASGAGAAAMDELAEQTRTVMAGGEAKPEIFSEPCAFNVFSHDSAMNPETGLNVEEQKMIDETKKIWGDDSVRVSPTCIRVGVLRAHSEAISVELDQPATLEEARSAIAGGAGLELVDDRAGNSFPTPLKVAGRDVTLVGRLRVDPGCGDPAAGPSRHFEMFVSGDQLRKGAALNALQIAEALQR